MTTNEQTEVQQSARTKYQPIRCPACEYNVTHLIPHMGVCEFCYHMGRTAKSETEVAA